VAHPETDEGHIGAIVQRIAPAAALARLTGKSGPDLVKEATDQHLKFLKGTLRRESRIIGDALDRGRLDLVVAKYLLHSGKVETLMSTF
jgi:hypothetical protein